MRARGRPSCTSGETIRSHFRVKGRVNTGRKIRRVHTKLGVAGSERFEPCGFHRRIPLFHITKVPAIWRPSPLG
jgi:hypothetical protein